MPWWQGGRFRVLTYEPLGVGGVGGSERFGPLGVNDLGMSIVDVVWVCQAMPECRCSVLLQPKNRWQNARAAAAWRTGRGSRAGYFRVRNWASEYGLSLAQCGREWRASGRISDTRLSAGIFDTPT